MIALCNAYWEPAHPGYGVLSIFSRIYIKTALPARVLDDWISDLTDDQRRRITAQLSGHLAELRAIPPPSSGVVSAINNAPLLCDRLMWGKSTRSPFPSIEALHQWLRCRRLNIPPAVDEEHVWRTVHAAHARSDRLVLTHNDLAPRNILIDGNFNVSGIVDWECAAWLPEYWEYTKALYTHIVAEPFGGPWNDMMDAIFPQYALEKEAEEYLTRFILAG
ncbi:hypothetical protein BV20DRAFT_1057400 [Pilatotrama ljubarskyi]|nr:hypothetical protein BV20DRAFT_1057400 [Pilatotrama ljubarskyi]